VEVGSTSPHTRLSSISRKPKSNNPKRAKIAQAVRAFVRGVLPARPRREAAPCQAADPLLGELWDNPRDAIYDRLARIGAYMPRRRLVTRL